MPPPPQQVLIGFQNVVLIILGKFNANVKTEGYCTDQDIYVVKELTQSLLG